MWILMASSDLERTGRTSMAGLRLVIALVALGLLGCNSIRSNPEPDLAQAKSAVGVSCFLIENNRRNGVTPSPLPDNGQRVTCTECKGSGKASHLGATFDCPNCNGKGWVPK